MQHVFKKGIMKTIKKQVSLWGFVLIHVIAMISAAVTAMNGGDFQISMGLFGILLFSYFAGASLFGFGNMILMNVISAACAFLFENTSVSFGFPFGYFNHFAEGIRIVNVPLQVGFGYYFYAFAGWLLADLLIGRKGQNDLVSKIGRPLIGAFIASGMDLTTDAINGLVNGDYEYPAGGGFFGSPLTNSLGWIFTVFVTLLLWEILIIPRVAKKDNSRIGTASSWHLQNAILVALQVTAPLIGFPTVKDFTVTDCLGYSWQAHYAYESSTMIALLALVMAGIIGTLVWIRRRAAEKTA